jgi:hypothetical protein
MPSLGSPRSHRGQHYCERVELLPEVWIPIVCGVAAVAFALGWGLRARRSRPQARTLVSLSAELADAVAARDEALAEAKAQSETIDRLHNELAQRAAVSETDRPGAHAPDMLSVQEVLGLEAELATLRVVAARTRSLEARIAELESMAVIDLRTSADEHAR